MKVPKIVFITAVTGVLFIQINSVHIYTNYFPKVKVKVQLSLCTPQWPMRQCSSTSTQPYYRNWMQLSGQLHATALL